MSSLLVSDNNTDYVSVNSYDENMVEIYTAGTAPPSSISESTESSTGFSFVTALPDFANSFDQSLSFCDYCTSLDSMGPNGFAAEINAQDNTQIADPELPAHLVDTRSMDLISSGLHSQLIHLGAYPAHPEQYTAFEGPSPGLVEAAQAQQVADAGTGVRLEQTNMMDPSTANIYLMIKRMEGSVGAILLGINTLTANDGSVNPEALHQPLGRVGRRSSRSSCPRAAKMAPLVRQIREAVRSLVGPNFMEEGNVVSLEALKVFAELWTSQTDITLQPACCEIESFCVDLLGSPRSPWNQSASRIFSGHFIETYDTPAEQQYLVQHFFFQQMKSLQATYRKERANAAAKKAAITAKRHHQRRSALFTKRMDIALQHPLLRDHVPILRKLGVSGMSSDESDIEDPTSGQVTRYLVHKPIWRAEPLSAWLRVFDSLHVLSRKLSATGTRGSFPRLHVESEVESVRGFVKNLPVTAYDPKWLYNHIAANFNVGQTPEEYSFTHHNQIFSYLRYRNM